MSPALIVDAPPAFDAERRYIFDLILGDWLGLEWDVRPADRSDVRIGVADDDGAAVVVPDVLLGLGAERWLTPESLPRRPLRWLPAGPSAGPAERLPVLYGPDPPAAALIIDDGRTARLGIDVFGGALFMLSRYEELVVGDRDQYGRFPAAASLAHAEGFLGIPVVDAYVEVLWAALRSRWPRLERRRRGFRLALTHDVDRPLSFLGQGVRGRVRQVARDVIIERDAGLVARRVRSWAGIRRADHRLDPDNTFDFLMAVSERHGLASAFYFLASEEVSAIEGFYTLDHPWIRALIATVDRRGHEVGYHGGFRTHRDAALTATEFARLRETAAALGIERDVWGGRQHYLRFEAPGTWSNWEAAGLGYDSTLGYSEHVGFRTGTCREFPAFDLLERRPLRLRERPLIVMDVTLFGTMALGPDAAAETVLDLARTCRRHEGTFTLLWHNSELQTARRRAWYEGTVAALAGIR